MWWGLAIVGQDKTVSGQELGDESQTGREGTVPVPGSELGGEGAAAIHQRSSKAQVERRQEAPWQDARSQNSRLWAG